MALIRRAEELLIRAAASGALPARWFLTLPDEAGLAARTGRLSLEIVSHCWQYAHLLMYQLSSLVNFPPTRAKVRMTVFHSPEDAATAAMLGFFGGLTVPNVTWNWQLLPREQLFRRAIGRNRIARTTDADWLWLTDCDIVFHRDCLDTLADRLQGRRDRLLFPRDERVTPMLSDADPTLEAGREQPRVADIETGAFEHLAVPRATGAYQIIHGDVARACGYCDQLAYFQRPVTRWAKTFEDRAFRWLMRTEGVPLDIPGVHRIRHVRKGRYGDNKGEALVRGGIRRAKAQIKERLST